MSNQFVSDIECGRIVNIARISEFRIENGAIDDSENNRKERTEFALVAYLNPRKNDDSIREIDCKSDFVVVDYFDDPCSAAKYLLDLVGEVGGSEDSPIKLLAKGKNRWGNEYNPQELERYKNEVVEDVQLDFL